MTCSGSRSCAGRAYSITWSGRFRSQNKARPERAGDQSTGANFAKPPKYISGTAPKPFQDPNDPDIGVPLSIEQQDEWAKSRGENLSRLMEMKMASPMWEHGSRELKKQMLEQAGAKAEHRRDRDAAHHSSGIGDAGDGKEAQPPKRADDAS